MTLDTILQWSIVDPTVRTFYTHWTHSNEVCFSNGFPSLAPLRYTHKVHFPRMYLARLLFELRDGISSIYIYIPGIKALAPFMTFLHRSIDRLYRASIYRESHSLTFRMKRHIPWSGEWYYEGGWEWKYALAARNCYSMRWMRETKVTRQIFLPDGNNNFSIFSPPPLLRKRIQRE